MCCMEERFTVSVALAIETFKNQMSIQNVEIVFLKKYLKIFSFTENITHRLVFLPDAKITHFYEAQCDISTQVCYVQ